MYAKTCIDNMCIYIQTWWVPLNKSHGSYVLAPIDCSKDRGGEQRKAGEVSFEGLCVNGGPKVESSRFKSTGVESMELETICLEVGEVCSCCNIFFKRKLLAKSSCGRAKPASTEPPHTNVSLEFLAAV